MSVPAISLIGVAIVMVVAFGVAIVVHWLISR